MSDRTETKPCPYCHGDGGPCAPCAGTGLETAAPPPTPREVSDTITRAEAALTAAMKIDQVFRAEYLTLIAKVTAQDREIVALKDGSANLTRRLMEKDEALRLVSADLVAARDRIRALTREVEALCGSAPCSGCAPGCTSKGRPYCHCQACGETGVTLTAEGYCSARDADPAETCATGCTTEGT